MSAREPEPVADDDVEVVDALPVEVDEEPLRAPVPTPATPVVRAVSAVPARNVPVAQAAAVAATGFAAGAVTAAVVRQVGRRRGVKAAAKRQVKGGLPVLGTRSFLVDVHLLGPRIDAAARLMVHVRVELRPAWPFRLPRGGLDGVARRSGTVLERLLHVEGERAIVRAAQPAPDVVVIGAWAAAGRDVGEEAIARMRFALGVDDDLRDFYERFRFDPLIGPSVRRLPHLRVTRRPEPFEALAWAVCEQLIEFSRAVEIERRIVRRWGARCAETGLRDVPDAARVAQIAPAELEACDLSAGRALALRRVAREVAAGRVDLRAADHERGWARLRAIPGIGTWTCDVLALLGQGRYDVLPAGDLGYRKLVGALRAGGDPAARAEEDEVRAFFAPYEGWAGLAGAHALRGTGRRSPAPLAA